MKNRNHVLTVVAIIAILAILAIFIYYYKRDGRKSYSWTETYKIDEKQPYGAYIISELLKGTSDDHTFEVSKKAIRNYDFGAYKGTSNYVFIGSRLFYSEVDLDSLLSFVSKGNNAFISCEDSPSVASILDYLLDIDCDHYFWFVEDDAVDLNLPEYALTANKKYEIDHIKRYKRYTQSWLTFDSLDCDTNIRILGYVNDDNPNFIEVPYGQGFFYIHSVPDAFSNLHMAHEPGLVYAEKVFSYLPEGNIYWDEYSKLPNLSNDSNRGQQESPFKYILSQPGLRWAWYLLLSLVLLYLVFQAKRKQRTIPVIESNTNTSIEFTETIGRLYFQQNNHRKLGLLKMKLFLEYIRNHYHINTNEIDENLIQKIVTKSEVPFESVERIFRMYNRINKITEVSEELLINFHEAIQAFYQNCK
ncbi:hypothetical protein QQ008_25380 [Fulvivirgaceae bacterium BMA10]|uniref:DUF4350 domain-containing protein n=1 Tax=Splendidivirga corallicola TaxID=3051826 RepID=A0ABT8KWH8_9BACT|nr:hypothetical protein [Fulvivirgaceae bacterium BMA10]